MRMGFDDLCGTLPAFRGAGAGNRTGMSGAQPVRAVCSGAIAVHDGRAAKEASAGDAKLALPHAAWRMRGPRVAFVRSIGMRAGVHAGSEALQRTSQCPAAPRASWLIRVGARGTHEYQPSIHAEISKLTSGL